MTSSISCEASNRCASTVTFSAGKETPDNLRIKINLSIGSTALVLLGSDNTTELLRAGLDGLKSIVHMYPETIEVLAAVQVSQLLGSRALLCLQILHRLGATCQTCAHQSNLCPPV